MRSSSVLEQLAKTKPHQRLRLPVLIYSNDAAVIGSIMTLLLKKTMNSSRRCLELNGWGALNQVDVAAVQSLFDELFKIPLSHIHLNIIEIDFQNNLLKAIPNIFSGLQKACHKVSRQDARKQLPLISSTILLSEGTLIENDQHFNLQYWQNEFFKLNVLNQPNHGVLIKNLIEELMTEKEFFEASIVCQMAGLLHEPTHLFFGYQAICYHQLNMPLYAIKSLTQAILTFPNDEALSSLAQYYVSRGELLFGLKDLAGAQRDCRDALILDNTNQFAKDLLAKALTEQIYGRHPQLSLFRPQRGPLFECIKPALGKKPGA